MNDTTPAAETAHAAEILTQDVAAATQPCAEASQSSPEAAAPPLAAAPDEEPAPQDDAETDDESPRQNGFADLGLSPEIVRAVSEMGYLLPTPIQAQAIPSVLMGRDVLGCAQTGTGKTAGFTLPLLDILSGSRARARMPRSLILEPTRELALQVAENFVMYGRHLKLTHALIIGGESMSDQRDALMRGVDVLIATPGRLIDMIERGGVLLNDCRVLVIDEADRMLDMGFIPDVERIVGMLPATRQTLFFSATMAPEIRRLADAFLQNPKEITVSKPASVVTTIVQAMTLVAEQDKREALRRLIRSEDVQNALIFCNRKKDVDILFKSLSRHGFSVGALHGDMAQPVRFATLEKFKAGEIRLLCCSDVAARGIDIGGLSHVFNFDVPIHAEDYVHRIGRTGRAGREGHTFMLATPEERLAVEALEKLTGYPVPRMQIPGLDPVEWAEGDGKRRRRGKAAPRPEKKADKPDRQDERRPKRAEGRRADPKPVAAPPAERVRDAGPPPVEMRRPRVEADTSRHTPAGPRDTGRDTGREASRREAGREAGRDQRRSRTDEPAAGSNVVGFGADVPAFMLVPARRRPLPGVAEDVDTAA